MIIFLLILPSVLNILAYPLCYHVTKVSFFKNINIRLLQSKPTIFDDISDEDLNLIDKLALGEDHVKELSRNVEIEMDEQWDQSVSFVLTTS